MKELLNLIKTSKTAKAGLTTIIWGILLLFGITDKPVPQTIDQLGQEQKSSSSTETLVGLGALGSGFMTLKGRNDAEKKIKGLENEKS